MKQFRKTLRKLVHNPLIDFFVGGILMVSGLWETWDTLIQDLANNNFRAGHGVALFGLITALRAVADFFGGLEFLDEAEYTEKKRSRAR